MGRHKDRFVLVETANGMQLKAVQFEGAEEGVGRRQYSRVRHTRIYIYSQVKIAYFLLTTTCEGCRQ